MAEIRIYNIDALGKPLGQYSHMTRVKAGEFLFIAGMLAPGDDFDAQCAGVFAQIEKAVKTAGAGGGNVVQFTTYLVHSQDIARFMQFRLREFPRMFPNGAYPPNTLLIIDRLVGEQYLLEVQTVAAPEVSSTNTSSRFLRIAGSATTTSRIVAAMMNAALIGLVRNT